jgi:hypothetical protein
MVKVGLQIGIPETLDTMEPIEIYDHALSLKAAFVERYACASLPFEWQKAQGFYVLLSPISATNQFEAYIGKTDAGFARRLHAHNEKKDFWTLAVLFKKDSNTGFNTTQTNYLEGLLRNTLDLSPNVKVHNEAWTGDKSLSELDKPHMEAVLLSALRILFLRGYRNAHMATVTTKLEQGTSPTRILAPSGFTTINSSEAKPLVSPPKPLSLPEEAAVPVLVEGASEPSQGSLSGYPGVAVASVSTPSITELSEEEVFNQLRQWRTKVAREFKWSPAYVATDNNFKLLIASEPKTLEELFNKGIARKALDIHGVELLDILL